MRCQRGQATVEWVAVVLVVAVALAALVAVGPRIDGRSFGGFLAHAFMCAVRGDCAADEPRLVAVHGASDAALLREYAPNIVYEPGIHTLPIDPRVCREHLCSDAPDNPDLDVHSSRRGAVPATAFTHVVHEGGETFLQYWFYYPDSSRRSRTRRGSGTRSRARRAGRSTYPGFHYDDWESYQVRIAGRERVGTGLVASRLPGLQADAVQERVDRGPAGRASRAARTLATSRCVTAGAGRSTTGQPRPRGDVRVCLPGHRRPGAHYDGGRPGADPGARPRGRRRNVGPDQAAVGEGGVPGAAQPLDRLTLRR